MYLLNKLLARRMIRKFIDDPEERENAQASAQVQSSTIAASPVLPTQMPSVPSIYPQSAVPPYPIHQLKPVYPHEMGFCLPSSSLQATVITMESHIVAENPQGESINNTKDV